MTENLSRWRVARRTSICVKKTKKTKNCCQIKKSDKCRAAAVSVCAGGGVRASQVRVLIRFPSSDHLYTRTLSEMKMTEGHAHLAQ